MANPMAPRSFLVDRRHRETRDTVTLELVPVEGDVSFKPGQFTMLYVFGIGEIPVSISGDPEDSTRLTQTVRAVGAVSSAICDLEVGSVVGVRGPFGTSWPVESMESRHALVVAGGIGMAPLRPAVAWILNHRERYRSLTILYGARTKDDLLFTHELELWGGRFDTTVLVTVDRDTEGWHGSVGVVTNLVKRAVFDPEHSSALVCGPEIMMRFASRALLGEGVPHDQVWMSMERNMQCAIGVCGHCQWGANFVCKDGPVFPHDIVSPLMKVRSL